MGFEMANATTIQNCASTSNEGDGIKITNDCVVRRNLCQANGSSGDGAGIHATSTDNRLESNNVTDNDRGIDVDAAGNLILKNTASGNTTNFDIAANNVFGAIVDERLLLRLRSAATAPPVPPPAPTRGRILLPN